MITEATRDLLNARFEGWDLVHELGLSTDEIIDAFPHLVEESLYDLLPRNRGVEL